MKNLFSVEGKVALVTGGSRGIGEMIAEGLVANGVRVYICARKAEACDATAARLSEIGECISVPADLSTEAGITALVEQIASAEEQLDILINNAGATWGAPLDDFPVAAFEKVMNLNVNSVFELTRQCLPLLRKGASAPDPSRVVITSSVEGLSTSRQANFPYSASKAGVIHLAKHLAKTVAPENITVNCLAPGPFESKMMAFALDNPDMRSAIAGSIPLQRIGEPEDVAGAVIYLCSRAGAYVTGQTLAVDGGLVLGPA
ncbi:MAG: 3-oxoacyl-ACP reductase [Spirochaeta sp.]|nr:3-oxoacyl-ACP reductase [Spirochaeta sp.]RPG07326.1 MAG: SDR family oxidoreductase [Proteobacteria bacterium TMED72]